MHRLVILLAALLYTSAVQSSLPFFGPSGMEYELKSHAPPQIDIEEKKGGDKVEQKDRTQMEMDEEEEDEGGKDNINSDDTQMEMGEEEDEESEENIHAKNETQTKMEGKDVQNDRENVKSKENKQKDETQMEKGEEVEMEDDEGEDMDDEEEGEMEEGKKENHPDLKEMPITDMDAEESEESRSLEVKPRTKPRKRSRAGGGGKGGRGRPRQFPYVAYIELIQCKCTGFLLTDQWLLTSSHCFLVDPLFKKLETGRVYVGTTSVPVSKSSLKHVQLRLISEVKILPLSWGEPKARDGAGDGKKKRPCGRSKKTRGGDGGEMQESRCSEVKVKHRGKGGKRGCGKRGKKCSPIEDTDQDLEPEDQRKGEKDYDDLEQKDEREEETEGKEGDGKREKEGEDEEDGLSPGQQERAAGSGELALVRVDDRFEMNEHIGFIRLVGLPFPGKLECKVVGFAVDKVMGDRKRLLWRNVEVWNGTKCNFIHRLALDRDSLCSKGPKGRPGCPEDIGGPVVCLEGTAAAAIIAHSLSNPGATAVYDCRKHTTNVFVMGGAHLPWIQSIVPDLPLPVDPPEDNKIVPNSTHRRSFRGSGKSGGVTTTSRTLTSGVSSLSGFLVGCCYLLHWHV